MPSMPCPKERWPHLLTAATAVALLCAGGAPSQASVTIDFGPGPDDASLSSPYQEDGFNVAGSSDLFLDGFEGNPARSITLDDLTSQLTISSIAGAAFSLESFDSLCTGSACPTNLLVAGVLAGGGATGPVSVSSSAIWTTARAFAGFVNLSSLTITPEDTLESFFHIDNIVLSPVPLPAALPLLATALAGLGLARAKQQHVKPLRPTTA